MDRERVRWYQMNRLGHTDGETFLTEALPLPAPSTAHLYDWNLLPIGQLLWLKELMSYVDYPPLQLAASYNLQQVLDQVQEMSKDHPSQ